MENPGLNAETERRANGAILRALEAKPNLIDLALLAIEGDSTEIITDATGTAREVTFVAPEFPATYESKHFEVRPQQ